ncbi:hypothetical protein DL93DRAFT_2234055 [Clavulina sp. PMI_390]|nr:hypothetical protein DL93DRAFT_2234055 [Clavulina sp. PMI_390]
MDLLFTPSSIAIPRTTAKFGLGGDHHHDGSGHVDFAKTPSLPDNLCPHHPQSSYPLPYRLLMSLPLLALHPSIQSPVQIAISRVKASSNAAISDGASSELSDIESTSPLNSASSMDISQSSPGGSNEQPSVDEPSVDEPSDDEHSDEDASDKEASDMWPRDASPARSSMLGSERSVRVRAPSVCTGSEVWSDSESELSSGDQYMEMDEREIGVSEREEEDQATRSTGKSKVESIATSAFIGSSFE